MAASTALSNSMILNSQSHNNACDQPQCFIVIKAPGTLNLSYILQFHTHSKRTLRGALMLLCEESLWHSAWCTFHGLHSCPTWWERRKETTPAPKCGLFGLRLTPCALNKWSKRSSEIVLPLLALSNDIRGGVRGATSPPHGPMEASQDEYEEMRQTSSK